MRVLITGASGFAGGWLALACARAGDEVTGVSRSGATPAGEGVAIDLTDADGLTRVIAEAAPDVVYHLAAQSHVGVSWDQPAETIETNMVGAVNVLEAIRRTGSRARIVWASSSEVYGDVAELPISEDAALCPATPYAVSKAAGDQLAAVYADKHELQIVRARPFNHAGPGQQPDFLISSLAKQAARAKLEGADHLRIVTGNPESRRDFTDVRDVARAYRLLSNPAIAPGAYNISSGHSVSVAENTQTIAELIAPIEVEHLVDPARVRSGEVMDRSGSFDKLREATGWEPRIPLQATIADSIDWWQAHLRVDGRGNTGPDHRKYS